MSSGWGDFTHPDVCILLEISTLCFTVNALGDSVSLKDHQRAADYHDASGKDAPVCPRAEHIHEGLGILELRDLADDDCEGVVGAMHQHGEFQ